MILKRRTQPGRNGSKHKLCKLIFDYTVLQSTAFTNRSCITGDELLPAQPVPSVIFSLPDS